MIYFTGVKRPSLSKFHRDRVHRARLHANRNFHSLVNLRSLFKWGFGPDPSDEAIAHEVTVRKSKHILLLYYLLILFNFL